MMIKSWFRRSFPKSKTHSDVLWKPESVQDKLSQPLTEMKLCGIWLVCPKVTYILMFAKTVPESEFSYCGCHVAHTGAHTAHTDV